MWDKIHVQRAAMASMKLGLFHLKLLNLIQHCGSVGADLYLVTPWDLDIPEPIPEKKNKG